jgi:PAS domain S-box-containing protein
MRIAIPRRILRSLSLRRALIVLGLILIGINIASALWDFGGPLPPDDATRVITRTVLTSLAMLAVLALAAWVLAQRERALQRSERRFRAMIEQSSDAVFAVGPGAEVVYVNPTVERVLGYNAHEFVGRNGFDFIHPDHLEHARTQFYETLRKTQHTATNQVPVLHKDGSWRWIEYTLSNLLAEPSVRAAVVSFRDITERKLAEEARAGLEQRLRQAEKMEAIGRLAGGIAHDFNNVLGGILGYGEMLAEETTEGTRLRRYTQNILVAANRARDLVDQILTYSRSQRGKRLPVDLGRMVSETLELVRGSLVGGIRLEASVPAAPILVIGDSTRLHQVIMNLCTNAIQAMAGRGTLQVSLDTLNNAAERTLAHGSLAPGDYARITVADTGPGMDAATLARIFEPFFTTKETGKGTGLGLSLVYGIVTDAGGAIDVASVPGQGSRFSIYVPRLEAEAQTTGIAEDAQASVPRGRGERVLVVDDQATLLAMTAEILSRLGYEPLPFSDSRAAFAAFAEAPGTFDALITDEVMPGLTGTELAGQLHRLRPDLPVLLASGYLGPMMSERAHLAGIGAILKKPVQTRELATALARILHPQQDNHPVAFGATSPENRSG